MRFQVETRGSVMQVRPTVPHVIVSIADSVERRLDVPTNEHTLDVLWCFFHDVDSDRDGMTAFSQQDAQRIISFFQHYRSTAQLLIVHCDAGQCRSPAVAAALQKIQEGDDNHWFATKRPNRLVYRQLLEAAHERGLI